ncbi:MAG: hypothetical protein AAB693_01895 [Patescibacteria group bacterium]
MKEKIKIKNKKVSVEDLAVMVAGGFDRMDKRMNIISNEIKEVCDEMKEEFDGVKNQIIETNDRIDFLAESRVIYEGHQILKSRVERIEKFIKI